MHSKVYMMLVVALAAAASVDSSSHGSSSWGRINNINRVEDANEMLMPTEDSRRQLLGTWYNSYGALEGDSVPCDTPGSSYYNCNGRGLSRPTPAAAHRSNSLN